MENIEVTDADLQTIYSDKKGIADYYEWADASYDEVGYFVSWVPNTSTIKICDGADILGVSVDSAGFVGNQSDEPRTNKYGLIMTSGLAEVRCELDVEVGDHIVSNAYGYAKKTTCNYGYKVLAKEQKDGVDYVVILLGVQADAIHNLGENLDEAKEALDVHDKNIVSAINVANQAYQKATETEVSNREVVDKVDGALDMVDKMNTSVTDMGTQVEQIGVTSAQAKAIAESAATSAESARIEAAKSADNALKELKDLTETLEPITTWTDPVTGNAGAEYLTEYINNGLATKTEIATVETNLEYSMAATTRNAQSIQSLVTNIDKYSVGEYSPAHGLTLEQAQSILEIGIIYAPTSHENLKEGTRSHKETYTYINNDETLSYEREFIPGYLYRWDYIPNSDVGVGWVTVGGSPSVYFTATEPVASASYKYWYTDGDEVLDISGQSDTYEPYTLYMWDDTYWLAVATLKGNINSRIISQVRQTADGVAAEVVNARGDAATLGIRLTDTEAEIQTVAAWKKDVESDVANIAAIEQKADSAGASIAQVVEAVGADGEVTAASIITAVNNDTSGVVISANHINLKGAVTFESFDDETKRQIEADTIDVQIWSSRGNIFKSGDASTILTCHVFKAGIDITDTLPSSAFTWTKFNNDGLQDETWTATPYGNNVSSIQISSADIWSRAIFNCAVEI